ncbi:MULTISPECIES: hypothetical protein [unclassified Phenylobacterium]|uniref:hypothetical protein n=1 Tax=unclassified Phenylobacterium TaxID=2640670 RepID=UPI0022B2CF18|nr:hypothetical protein [Phenylobacterium sp. NIBR 498073]MBS0489058.1 hypothetical protein [Pseudomonadota bacterium]WGU38231.1 hypothetical protein O4N75_11200 [Phenylobacterium sp. NIBR 498073]
MEFLKDRRTLLALVGGALALLAGLIIANVMVNKGKDEKPSAPPASKGGLVVETGAPDDGRLDPAKPLRCFVAGQYAGEMTLADCAKRNGVATGALDVGVDEAGNLAAADQAGTMLTPLPPQPEAVTPLNPAPTTPVQAPTATNAPAGGCWRYVDGGWRKLPNDLTLNACVQTLFAGRCERPGGATYGRWMQQTLRLVPGRVEVSGDNRSFRPLAEQAQNCSISTIG